jgi:ribosomal-protein-alanine N-acetyltransferase
MSEHARLSLRAGGLSDLDEMCRIENAAHVHPWSRELLAREFETAWSRVRVAHDEATGRLAGYIVTWLIHDEMHVLDVATDPARRREGIGRRLMLEAEAAARSAGAVSATLEVRRSNTPASTLYASLGYKNVGMRPRYYAPNGEDAFVMTKDLLA